MHGFDSRTRAETVAKIQKTKYDLIIIGGGITGAGISLDASSRGLKTLLIEKNDFASGTSSKSTKLIHGGLRYLKQFEIGLVREVGLERAIVHKLAPHLVRSEKMLIPLIKDGTFGKILTSIGLMVYDVLAGVEKEEQRQMLSKDETLTIEPELKEDILEGGGVYAEYRTDDARLTIEVLKTAGSFGADVLNYAKCTDFTYNAQNKLIGIEWEDLITKEKHRTRSTHVINAAGPWVDKVRAKDHRIEGKHLHPTKGVHIVVPHERLPIKHAVYFDEPDGRMLFAIPRDRITYVGTTDTNYEGDLDHPPVRIDDVNYLLRGANSVFPNTKLTLEDVASTWVGLRPLIEEEGKSASEISRKDEVFESESGLLSIAGGKLTGYRKMAEKILDKVAKREEAKGRKLKDCQTSELALSGGVFNGSKEVNHYTTSVEKVLGAHELASWANYLVSNYGRQSDDILKIFESRKEKDSEVRLGLSELAFTVEHESVTSLLDFFERRTGRLYFYIESIEKADPACPSGDEFYFRLGRKQKSSRTRGFVSGHSSFHTFQFIIFLFKP